MRSILHESQVGRQESCVEVPTGLEEYDRALGLSCPFHSFCDLKYSITFRILKREARLCRQQNESKASV